MAAVQNDTYGEITREELADLRRVAQKCTICGMLATVDPVFHQNRYGHAPVINRGHGMIFTWSMQHGWLVNGRP